MFRQDILSVAVHGMLRNLTTTGSQRPDGSRRSLVHDDSSRTTRLAADASVGSLTNVGRCSNCAVRAGGRKIADILADQPSLKEKHMSFLQRIKDFIRGLLGKPPKTPAPAAPVAEVPATPPVAMPYPQSPVVPAPVQPAPTPVTPTPANPSEQVVIPIALPPPPKPGDEVTMARPVIGIGFAPGSTTPYPILGKDFVPVTKQTVRFGPDFPYPKIVQTSAGVNMLLQEPLNEAFRPSMEAWMFGHDNWPNGTPRTFVGDPSNAPKGYARRSAAGYPLVYPNVHWDQAKQEWVGEPSGPPMISFNGSTFATDVAVEAYVVASAERDAALKKWEDEFIRTRYLGPVDATRLTKNDHAWLYIKSTEYQFNTPIGNPPKYHGLHRLVLNGRNIDMARVINSGEQHAINNAGVQPDGPLKDLLIKTVSDCFAAAIAGQPWEPKFVVEAA